MARQYALPALAVPYDNTEGLLCAFFSTVILMKIGKVEGLVQFKVPKEKLPVGSKLLCYWTIMEGKRTAV